MSGLRKPILAGTAGVVFLAGALTAAVLGFKAAPAAGQARAGVTTITVTAGKPSEYKFTFSKTTVPAGTVVFKVVNKGKKPHTFAIGSKKTVVIAPGKSATLTVTFTKAGSFAYRSTVAGQAAMKGVFVVTKPATGTTASTTTTKSTTTTTTTAAGCAKPASTTVSVQLFEYGITLSQSTVPCGTITFNVTNTGATSHSFDLVGVAAGSVINPGATTTVTANVTRAGSFRYQCDVGGHADQGMSGNLTVT